MSYYRQQLEQWLSELNVKADTVLDIGGIQGEVKNRVKSWNVINYEVLDLPDWDLDKKWQMYPTASVIFCLEVFEYLINPYQAIKNIESCLRQDGVAYITFAFAYPHHNELEMDSLRYTESGIKRLAESAGLRINNIWYRRDKSGLLKSFYIADGMRMAKQYPNHDVTGFIMEFTK